MTAQKSDAMTKEMVAQFLRDHPDFFQDFPDLMDVLQAPAPHGGKVVDFQQALAARKSGENQHLRDDLQQLIQSVRTQNAAQKNIHAAVLGIMAAGSFEELIHIVTSELSLFLHVDIVRLCVESDTQASIAIPHFRILPEGTINTMMARDQKICHRSGITGDPLIFTEAVHMVQSDVLLRLHIHADAPRVVLAIGSRNPHDLETRYSQDLWLFLAQVLEFGIRRWLILQI